jgi:SAM-dependent methyltransferase
MKVDYDAIAPHYNARYDVNQLPGVAGLLRQAALDAGAGHGQALEVGCGTGYWLGVLAGVTRHIHGLDLSAGMLRRAQAHAPASGLAQGQAGQLPFASGAFDLLLCVNALHHFPDKRAFMAESRRVLRPGGWWMNVGMDPHAGQDRWYLYDYFPGTLEADRQRFPSAGTLVDWAKVAGFARATWTTGERIEAVQRGPGLLADPFVQKHGTSQLALLSEANYHAGLARLTRVASEDPDAEFVTDLWLSAVVAQAPE